MGSWGLFAKQLVVNRLFGSRPMLSAKTNIFKLINHQKRLQDFI